MSSFYRYLAKNDLVAGNPVVGVERPVVDPDHTATVAITREEARALIAAAAADVGDLGVDRGHRVLQIVGKGNRKAKIPLTPNTQDALDPYLDERAARAGITVAMLAGPLLATSNGGRMTQSQLWELVRRIARAAGIPAWAQLSPHSPRHSAVTFALDAGTSLRDAQDFARHRDPRTTRRYGHSRGSLDRSAAYTVAAYLA